MGHRESVRFDLCSKGYIIILMLMHLIILAAASIHEYQDDSFIRRSNSFFFHGGSEGLYASKLDSDNGKSASEDKPLIGKSFIR